MMQWQSGLARDGASRFSGPGAKVRRALAPFVRGTAAFADLKRGIFIDPLAATPVTSSGIATAPVGLEARLHDCSWPHRIRR
jgi:hypothetical protein